MNPKSKALLDEAGMKHPRDIAMVEAIATEIESIPVQVRNAVLPMLAIVGLVSVVAVTAVSFMFNEQAKAAREAELRLNEQSLALKAAVDRLSALESSLAKANVVAQDTATTLTRSVQTTTEGLGKLIQLSVERGSQPEHAKPEPAK